MIDLVSAANDMYHSVSTDNGPTLEDVVFVATRGSEALKRAQNDQEVSSSINQLSNARRRHVEAFQTALNAYGESREQFEHFLEQERAVLRTAGLDPGLVEELITQARESVGRAREWEGDQKRFFEQVAQLQNVASSLATQLKELQEIAKALTRAAERDARLLSLLEQERAERLAAFQKLEQAERQVAMLELDALRRDNQELASQIAAARLTNQELTAQLAHTGSTERKRGMARVFWRLTFGVSGIVLVVANAVAAPLITSPWDVVSGSIGNALVGRAANNQ